MAPKTEPLTRTTAETRRLMDVALGKRDADLVLIHGELLNVYTGEILQDQSICIGDRWVACVGADPQASIGEKTRVIDISGNTVIPGLIDGHAHLAWLSTPAEFLNHAMAGGTTTVITEALEPYPVAGLEGLFDFLESLRNQPIKIFATAPSMVSISPAAKGIPPEDLRALLNREDIVGLGESYWQSVLQEPERYLPEMAETLRARKTVEGHSAGASGRKLMGYLAAGALSCHEPIQPQEVMERLRLGLRVMIREGSIRRDLEAIAKISNADIDYRRLILVSDGLEPGDLLQHGYMESIVQKAIHCGFEPTAAIRMATLNVAEHFKLDDLIGGIAPGRFADMLVIPDLETIRAEYVISNGKIIARDGKPMVSARRHAYRSDSLKTVRQPAKATPRDFQIRTPAATGEINLRVIELVSGLVTRESVLTLPVEAGEIRIHNPQDILKIAAVDRTASPGKCFTGLIKGFGLTSGALACSAAWDTTDIIVVGADEADMALAVNRIAELQGGAVFCEKGTVREELALSIFGLMSDLPLTEIDRKMKSLTTAVKQRGVPFPDPVLTLVTLTGAAIPFLRICEEGLVNLKDGKIVGLFCES